jgi:hypothetical protein
MRPITASRRLGSSFSSPSWPARQPAARRPILVVRWDSHRHLMITLEEWQAFMDDLQQTLDKFAVPQPEQEELRAIVESTREAIVVAPLQEEPLSPVSETPT